MTSKDRIAAIVRGRRPDRPGTSLRFIPESLELMREYLGIGISDNTQNEVLDRLNIDLRKVMLKFTGPREKSTPMLHGVGYDFWGIGYKKVTNKTSSYYEFDHHPLAEAECVADIENYDWPDLDWWDYEGLRE